MSGRRVGGIGDGDVDAVALECHRHEVWNADNESDEVDQHNREPGALDAAPDCAMSRVPDKQVPAVRQSRILDFLSLHNSTDRRGNGATPFT